MLLTLWGRDRVHFASIDKEPALQAAAFGDGCPTECGTGHSDRGGHPPRDRQLGQKEVSRVLRVLEAWRAQGIIGSWALWSWVRFTLKAIPRTAFSFTRQGCEGFNPWAAG